MSHIEVLAAQTTEVVVALGISPMALRYALQVEQSGLSHEDGFNLEEVVAMLGHSM